MNNLDYYVECAAKGERQGFEELYRQTYGIVYFTCINLLKNEQDALDVTQDVYVTVMNKIYTLEDKNKFLPWLNRITVNKCKDFLKKNRPVLMDIESVENLPLEENEGFLPEEYIVNQAKRQIVSNIIKTALSETEYQVILFYYFNELSVQEIAELMECPQGTVMYRLSAARAKIKKGVLAYENKNDDKLYSVSAVPFLASLFAAEYNEMIGNAFFNISQTGAAIGTTETAAQQAGAVAAHTAGKVGLGAMKAKTIIVIAAIVLVGGGIIAIVTNRNDKAKTTTEQVYDDSTEGVATDWAEMEDDTTEINELEQEETEEDISEEVTVDEEAVEEGFSGVEDRDIEDDKATIEVNGEETEIDMVYGNIDFREGKIIYNGVETTYKKCLEILLEDNWEVLHEHEVVSIDEISVEAGERESIYLIQKFTDENGELQDASSILLTFYNSADEELPIRDCDICSVSFAFEYGYNAVSVSLPGDITGSSTLDDVYNAFGVPTYIMDDKDNLDERITYTWYKDDVTLVILWDKDRNAFSSFRYEHDTIDYSQYF